MKEQSKEDKILLALAEDKFRQCRDQYIAANTGFLDLRQRSLVEVQCKGLCRSFGELFGKGQKNGLGEPPGAVSEGGETRYCFYGGYEDAERTICLFLPDYAHLEDSHPLAVIRAEIPPGAKQPTHRDYLGSLTGLGIRREMIGDILTHEQGADIIIMEEIKEFLLYNYSQAGRTPLRITSVPLEKLHIPEQKTVMHQDTVASLRLDNVISSAFSLSRAKAAEAVRCGLVFVNSASAERTDMQVREGDKLVLRGKGKAFLRQVGGRTRKDRIFIITERYL